MNSHVVLAIFRRNMLSYFSNPTGYVFICLFVVLSSAFTIWPYEFFNANLANLDQLNYYLPYILLIFVPAITMGIWADERRQGTDELLLTIPATDFEVVLGKYLAAIGVFSVSLFFSAICNLVLLHLLGNPDVWLLFANYFGYWLVGLAMLATGMVASFFTSNLTVSFILGVVFNAPLVAADWADAFTGNSDWAMAIKHWGLAEQFRDFGRGVISLSSIVYFVMLVVVMLYLCMVLIGRRHWLGGRDGSSLFGHYLARAVALVVIAAALNTVVEGFDLRYDVTAEKINTLSPATVELVHKLETKNRPIVIEAYISPSVPEKYVQMRLNLLTTLREFESLGRGKIQVQVVNAEPRTDEATRAEKQFGIRPRQLEDLSRGTRKVNEIFLGAAVTCGLEKVVIPFFDLGTPVEYELTRAIVTVSQEKRKRLGVVQTDAQLFGGFDMSEMQMGGMPPQRPKQPIIDELEKQYEVVQVDPSKPIEKFDVLLAVQPSSLGPPQMDNLIAAIKKGQATALFEDPYPWIMRGVPGTNDEKRGNPMTREMPQQKGDIGRLWDFLGVKMVSRESTLKLGQTEPPAAVVWQKWNPYPKIASITQMPNEFVFIGPKMPGNEAGFNPNDPVTSGLTEFWFPFPGAFSRLNASKMKFTELITTGDRTGIITTEQFMRSARDGSLIETETEGTTHANYTLAAHVTGEYKSTELVPIVETKDKDGKDAAKKDAADPADKKSDKDKDADKDKDKTADKSGGDKANGEKEKAKAADTEAPKTKPVNKTYPINVILVADIDLMDGGVLSLRADTEKENIGVHFDNFVFVQNAIDVLAGDERFVEIRKRKPAHRTLTTMEKRIAEYQERVATTRNEYVKKYNEEKNKTAADEADANKKFNELQRKYKEVIEKGEQPSAALELEAQEALMNKALAVDQKAKRDEQLQRDFNRDVEIINREYYGDVRREENFYKFMAVIVPPILPALVAVFVFFRRRAEEREGVAKSRLR